MTDAWKRIYFLVPSFQPVGGILRDLCFAHHARALGYEVVICCPDAYDPDLPLFNIPRLSELSPENGIEFTDPRKITVGPRDLAFFSAIRLHEIIRPRLSRWTRHEQVIHAVRGVRHATPSFAGGYALRLLSRPMARITTNDIVLNAIKPYLNPSSLIEVITVAHDTDFFFKERAGGVDSPVKVAYTTWKSDVGDRVASLLNGSGFEFSAVRTHASWEELRTLYHWADVFLATPRSEEGFYLPGLEAMAAGAIVLVPDVGGNRTYCDFGVNCLPVEFEDASSYAEVLRALKWEKPENVDRMRRKGYETLKEHTWDREERQFDAFLQRLTDRLDQLGPRNLADTARES